MTEPAFIKQMILCLLPALFLISEAAAQEQATGTGTTGYANRTGIELVAGGDFITPRFYMVNGYRFHPQFAVGIGAGITPYNDPLILLPLFIDADIALLNRSVSPVIQISAGRNISINTSDNESITGHRGGRFFRPAAGIKFRGENSTGISITAGYSFDSAKFRQSMFGPQTSETELTYRRVIFGIALQF